VGKKLHSPKDHHGNLGEQTSQGGTTVVKTQGRGENQALTARSPRGEWGVLCSQAGSWLENLF